MNPLFDEHDEKLMDEISKANDLVENEYENLGELKQGSKAWFNARLGKFTGSKIPDLMKAGRGKEEWGLTALNVIRKVYVERDLSDIGRELYVDELFAKNFRQTNWGNKYESYAREEFTKVTGINVEETHFQLHKEIPFIGGSFDGKCIGQNKIIEIKCPYDPLVHQTNLELDEEMMLKHDYYGQIQCNIEVAGAESCYFISYDPRRNNQALFILEVERDEEFLEKFLTRVLAAERMVQYMSIGTSVEGAMLLLKAEK